jgi:hypothetical protein
MPSDAVPGSTIAEDPDAEVLLRDGSWTWCQVIGQRRDRHGRWCVAPSAINARPALHPGCTAGRIGVRAGQPVSRSSAVGRQASHT